MYLVCRLLPCTVSLRLSTLSLHDALPICSAVLSAYAFAVPLPCAACAHGSVATSPATFTAALPDSFGFAAGVPFSGFASSLSASFLQPSQDRKSTRLNSSHRCISYAVFCPALSPSASPLFPYTTLFRSAQPSCPRTPSRCPCRARPAPTDRSRRARPRSPRRCRIRSALPPACPFRASPRLCQRPSCSLAKIGRAHV